MQYEHAVNERTPVDGVLASINWLVKQERYNDAKHRWYDKEIEKLNGKDVPSEDLQWDPEKCKAYATIFLANAKRGKDSLQYQKFCQTQGRVLDHLNRPEDLGLLFGRCMADLLHDLAHAAFYGKECNYGFGHESMEPVYCFPGMREQRPHNHNPFGFFPNDWIFLYKGCQALRFWEVDPGKWRLQGQFRLQYIGPREGL